MSSLFGYRFRQLVLVTGDCTAFFIALASALFVRYGWRASDIWHAHTLPFGILSILWVLSFYVAGLYDPTITRDRFRFLRTFLEAMIANLGIALAFFYLVPIFGIAPRTNLILDFVFALLFGYAWRLAHNQWIIPKLAHNRVMFIGHGDDARRVNDLLQSTNQGFELAAIVETEPGTRFQTDTIAWYTQTSQLERILADHQINSIVLGQKPDDVPGLQDGLYRTLFSQVTILDRAALEEVTTGRVPLEHVSQTWFLEHLRESDKAWYEVVKRIGDLLMAAPVGLLALITFPFVALLVKLSSPGPILYSHMRIGKMGKPFRIWKYRSMRQNAETEGRPQFAVKGDPRITRIGTFLRASRLDELPQVWNVLRGDMSFVGPRPERPEFVEELTKQMPYYALRHLTRPGLTGWSQVRFGYASTFEDNLKKLQYDLYYIKHRSLMLDFAILLRTIGIVLRRQGT